MALHPMLPRMIPSYANENISGSRDLKIRMMIIIRVKQKGPYDCSCLREEHRFRMLERRVLRAIFRS
jgi:hypothetical protein